nr:hypothetical protein [Intestinimonas butyriciproducens]
MIYSGGYDYPRLAAYLPGMRDILNARLERTAGFIVQQGTEATESGSWSASFEELEKRTGITVRRGNGFSMRRWKPSVISLAMRISMVYSTTACKCRTRKSWAVGTSPPRPCWPRALSCPCRKTPGSPCGTSSAMNWRMTCLSSMPRAGSQYRLNRRKN